VIFVQRFEEFISQNLSVCFGSSFSVHLLPWKVSCLLLVAAHCMTPSPPMLLSDRVNLNLS